MSPLRWRTGAAGRIAIASLPIMRMNWRRRRANSLRSVRRALRSVQPLLRRIDLPAKGQQFLEDNLGRHPDEFHQFRVSLLVGLVPFRIIARGARNFGEIADDLPDVPTERLQIRAISGTQSIEKTGAP